VFAPDTGPAFPYGNTRCGRYMSGMGHRPSLLAFAVLAAAVVFQIACPIVIASRGGDLSVGQFASQSDAARYQAIAETPGTPYRDFDVEYPPLAIGLFHAIGPGSFDAFRERLFALQVACQALIVFLLFRFWGRRTACSYVILSAPMLFVVYNGFDLIAVALAVSGAALIRRRHPDAGAATLVVGAFTKLWPVVLLPALLVRRQLRAWAIAVGLGLAGLAAWSAWGSAGAIEQVTGYRRARGWEYESLPGSMLRVVTRDALRFESGSWRVGMPPRLFSVMVVVVMVGAVARIWHLAARRTDLADGVAETAAITALLVFGTLLSPQFLIWPLPFVAIASGAGTRRLEAWAGAAAVLTLVAWISFDPYDAGALRSELVILARNAAIVGLLVAAMLEIRRVVPARRPMVSV
jgi:hypothetical protein